MTQDKLTVEQALELAVATEDLAADYYRHMADKFSANTEIKQVFAQLAEDEESHKTAFTGLLQSAIAREPILGDDPNFEYFRSVSRSRFFDKAYFAAMDEISDADQALGRALAFEKETLLYYQGLREFLGDNTHLDKVIEAEKRHVVNLTRLIPTEGKFRGLDDNF